MKAPVVPSFKSLSLLLTARGEKMCLCEENKQMCQKGRHQLPLALLLGMAAGRDQRP